MRHLVLAVLRWVFLIMIPTLSVAEPRILLGPTESSEEPETIETISGLSYDQLKKLRELRKWLEERQLIRDKLVKDQIRLPSHTHEGSLFSDRELFSPLGQRYSDFVSDPPPGDTTPLKFRPLPEFNNDPSGESGTDLDSNSSYHIRIMKYKLKRKFKASEKRSRVTHIVMPPPLSKDSPQIEYEINPSPNIGP